jgi:hypothetical protein
MEVDIPMQEQNAILAHDRGEWVLITDDEEPERVRKDIDAAMKELRQEGWQVVQGPAKIRHDPEFAGLERFKPWGYRLRQGIQ